MLLGLVYGSEPNEADIRLLTRRLELLHPQSESTQSTNHKSQLVTLDEVLLAVEAVQASKGGANASAACEFKSSNALLEAKKHNTRLQLAPQEKYTQPLTTSQLQVQFLLDLTCFQSKICIIIVILNCNSHNFGMNIFLVHCLKSFCIFLCFVVVIVCVCCLSVVVHCRYGSRLVYTNCCRSESTTKTQYFM
jgi:hypothetical protein